MSMHREILFYATEGFAGLELKDALRVCHGVCIMPETNPQTYNALKAEGS